MIEVKNLGKKYLIGEKDPYLTLRDKLAHPIKAMKSAQLREDFWALKDVNFSIEKGEVVGIIGKNGSGKSTLLKILSRITPPTTGEVLLRGHVGSLLEVGTGFHPELTGRENVYLSGSILGMRKREIKKKFDEIVDFAGIEKFLDTPVKRYSSGMYVRLGFAVAAHLETDILFVDEVLAVGDTEFQKKCMGKMDSISRREGRTIIFVSHNMAAVQDLCTKSILLEQGLVKMIGDSHSVIERYMNRRHENRGEFHFKHDLFMAAYISRIALYNVAGHLVNCVPINEEFFIEVAYEFELDASELLFSLFFYKDGDLLLVSSESDKIGRLISYKKGKYISRIKIPAFTFNVGTYTFKAAIHRPGVEYIDAKDDISFDILDEHDTRTPIFHGQIVGKMATILDFETTKI